MELDDLGPDPIARFRIWLDEATAEGIHLPNAMTLATASGEGEPSARMVLLKGVDEKGFTFFTNYESRKAGDLGANPRAALVFYWGALDRQVCVRGSVEKLSSEDSAYYFATRGRSSQLGAWASNQSRPLVDRATLDERFLELREQHEAEPIPLPPFWGGYLVRPRAIEFWAGRADRLHDRFRFTRDGDAWKAERLYP